MKAKKIGVLSFQGDVVEHLQASQSALDKLDFVGNIHVVRTYEEIKNLEGLIIPGGESTTLQTLCIRNGLWENMKRIQFIYGTCAGAIMLAKKVLHKTEGQQTLELMDLEIDRNAYGRQRSSFEKKIKTKLGDIDAVFIRSPKINNIGKNVKTIAQENGEVIACEQKVKDRYYLVTCFHPELTTTVFHEYFLKKIYLH